MPNSTVLLFCLPTLLCFARVGDAAPAPIALAPAVSLAGDWQVQVGAGEVEIGGRRVVIGAPVTLDVAPAAEVAVREEVYDALPLFNAGASGWTKGVRLREVATQETSAQGALVPDSVVVISPDGTVFARDRDYALDADWGTLGRLAGGQISEQTRVLVSYRYGPGRIDSVVVRSDGGVLLRPGVARVNLPEPPALAAHEVRLDNIWVSHRLPKLGADNLLPILENGFPEPAPRDDARKLLPKTLQKLRSGERLTILAWGDSVTDGGYLPSPDERWQAQFVRRLKQRFPRADIELKTEAWPGKNTDSYLNEPPGSAHNYAEKVLALKPDLIISEFVNDAGMGPEQVKARYGKLLADFRDIGAEWIMLTPHYVMPGWMGLSRERDIDDDPRPYVAGLRRFAAAHDVALADAALRWGRLWRQGLPYTTLLSNRINHPDARGMKLFADSLLALFPEK